MLNTKDFPLIKTSHTDQIDAHIARATDVALSKVRKLGKKAESRPGKHGIRYKHCFFSQYFHEEMNRVCVKDGLRIR